MVTAMMPPSEPLRGYSSALRVLQDPEWLKSEKHQEQHWRANRDGADERILLFEQRFISRMAKLGVPMFAHGVVRTVADQRAAFVQGHSKNDGSRPYPHKAWACDIVHGRLLWDGVPPEGWLLLGHIGKEVASANGLKMVWGGDWKRKPSDAVGWDPAHWELADWRSKWT